MSLHQNPSEATPLRTLSPTLEEVAAVNQRPKRDTGQSLQAIAPWRMNILNTLGNFYFRVFHRISFHGQKNIPKSGAFLIVSNHPTYMDPVIIGLGLHRSPSQRWAYWLAWEELFTWPVLRHSIPELGAIPVSLEKKTQLSSLRASLKAIRSGHPLAIFFEGERSQGPLMNKPLPGAARLALRTGTPILPVTISGAYKVWPKGRSYPKPGRLVVVYHDLIEVPKQRGGRCREAETTITTKLRSIIEWPLIPDGRACSASLLHHKKQHLLKAVNRGVKTDH